MEVATSSSNGGVPPFHDHDVREWSTLNSLTGVLERARIETDHWAANTNNSCHKYGKVVDSRARTDADGALRQQARRQLEVFQSQVPGGQLQVIKAHSVSSSRWTHKRAEETANGGGEFEGLQIPTNPLDLSFQKSKAIIARSAARRPPSRIKNKDDTSPQRQQNLNVQQTASTNLLGITRLCHQVHENAINQAFGRYPNKSPITDRLNLTKTNETEENYNKINEKKNEITYTNGHTNLLRTKSSSSEDFLINLNKDKSTKSIEDLEDLEHLQTWRRTSKIRRSLQYPKQEKVTPNTPNKPIHLPEASVSVRKITEDFEKGRRLSTALRGNNIDLQTLDQILQTISSSSSEKTSVADEEIEPKKEALKSKRNSFVTVESIQEIKGRLRRTSSPEKNVAKDQKEPETDDGIVTEENISKSDEKMIDSTKASSHSKVKSYVYGMESSQNKKHMIGTGSLESRSKLNNGTTNRNEDWYNRRKSYGFEPVQNQNESMSSKKKIVESSTDSGICRSSEVIVVPSVIKNHHANSEESLSDSSGALNKVSSTELNKDSSFGNVRRISSLFDNASNKSSAFGAKKENESIWNRNKTSNKENEWGLNSGITIKIPIISTDHWNNEPDKEIKRHSIAVDETKYVSQNKINEARRTSLVINDKFLNAPAYENGDDFSGFNKKSKKVEFCKTEVHFAAESGKVNIVETDEKPPPTQNFRRRRRNPNTSNYLNDFNKNGLPILHFGENYIEKNLFGNGNQNCLDDIIATDDSESGNPSRTPFHGVVTVNSDFNLGLYDDDRRDLSENESIKGILKNKMVKPKPYHLGENPISFNMFDDENPSWNCQTIPEKEQPLWKSTVTVSNTLFDNKMGSYEESVPKTLDSNYQPDLIRDQLKRLTEHRSDFKNGELERVRPFLSVAERIRHMEETQKSDSYKGYSTRVNIGDGQAIVVQNSGLSSNSDIYMEPTRLETKEKSETANPSEEPTRIKAEIKNRKYSPIVLRKNPLIAKTAALKSANVSETLSSPSLVRKNSTENILEHIQQSTRKQTEIKRKETVTKTSTEAKSAEESSRHSFIQNEKILRQPKKSEMAYFGVPEISQTSKLKTDTYTKETKNIQKDSYSKKEAKTTAPIYENVSPIATRKYESKFDSCILDELTRAADEILKAVKESEEELLKKQKKEDEEETKIELSTISENKSWNHQEKTSKPVDRPCKSKLTNASSNSSLEGTPRDAKPTHRYISNTKASADKIRTKTTSSESSGLKATTKARRLQRASSREALLQSHGSSSEDLTPKEVPVRKPRLVKKTKTTQMNVTNGITEISKKATVATNAKRKTETSAKPKADERLPGALPEIRHKTAVSTIKSTVDKGVLDRSKHRGEDSKKKVPLYKEFSKVSPTSVSPLKTKRETVTHRLATANIKKYRPERH